MTGGVGIREKNLIFLKKGVDKRENLVYYKTVIITIIKLKG